jgi:hypothetical protein
MWDDYHYWLPGALEGQGFAMQFVYAADNETVQSAETEPYPLIKSQYEHSCGDSTRLFQAILAVMQETRLEGGLALLEKCVTEKRLAWLDKNLEGQERTGDPLWDAYHIFYEVYLGISPPQDGEIIERSPQRIVTRWWNRCPTLEACQKLSLDTRQVCRLAYHQPVQAFLLKIDPRLRFERNYAAICPHQAYCEELIIMDE